MSNILSRDQPQRGRPLEITATTAFDQRILIAAWFARSSSRMHSPTVGGIERFATAFTAIA
jgi:hypothetical protein